MDYFAGDGLPLRVGDIVTCADDVSGIRYAHYLIRGVVQEEKLGYIEDGEPVCVVEFTESTNGPFAGNCYICLMKHLVHLEGVPEFPIPDFENMFCAMLGMK